MKQTLEMYILMHCDTYLALPPYQYHALHTYQFLWNLYLTLHKTVRGIRHLPDRYLLFIIIIYYLPDMINMIRLGFVPHTACWIFSTGDAIEAVAVYVSKLCCYCYCHVYVLCYSQSDKLQFSVFLSFDLLVFPSYLSSIPVVE